MAVLGVDSANNLYSPSSGTSEASAKESQDFQTTLDSVLKEGRNDPLAAASPGNIFLPDSLPAVKPSHTAPSRQAALAYTRQAEMKPGEAKPVEPAQEAVHMSDLEKYKDDQLLRNPGGKDYNLDEKKVEKNPKAQQTFWGRVGKDLSDSWGNVKNFFKNLAMGSKILYRDKNNQIQEGRQRGVLAAVGDFFKDLGSALSFGYMRRPGEKEPQGFGERLKYSLGKLKDAIAGDLVGGVSGGLNHMGKNLILAGWNLVEVLPDATIGNFEGGKKLSNTIFDNGQVVIEYLTDVAPTGDAWLRVHAASLKAVKPPVLYNISMPENNTDDVRWQYVRNTPFRKTIETIGALLADAASIALIGQTASAGKPENKHPADMLLQ